VAHNGTDWFVAWTDKRNDGSTDIYGTLVTPDGDVMTALGTALSGSDGTQQLPDVASDGATFLVVWEYTPGNTITADVRARPIGSSGAVLNSGPIAVSDGLHAEMKPRVAFDGVNWLIVWEDLRSNTSLDVYGARMDSQGTIVDPDGFAITNGSAAEQTPALAYNGTDTLVVWTDYSNGTADIFGARVDADGTVVGDPFAISSADGDQAEPAVAYAAPNWVVAWTDARADIGASDVYMTEVDAEGTVSDEEEEVSDERYTENKVATAAGPAQTTLIAYGTVSGATARVKIRIASPECLQSSIFDTTCDGIDDDCDGTADDNFIPVPTTCGSGDCAATGQRTCNDGDEIDDCMPNSGDRDGDMIPNCRDACPDEAANNISGCRPIAPSGEAGSGGMPDDGSAGASSASGGTTSSGGRSNTPLEGGASAEGGDTGAGGDDTDGEGGQGANASAGRNSGGTGGRTNGSGADSGEGPVNRPPSAAAPLTDEAEAEGGCGCRATPSRTSSYAGLLLAGAAFVLGARRRRPTQRAAGERHQRTNR
jgi:MYXO-CTERM domain-containing protein